ncbi:MAG: cyclic nucleotide-binding domain-containing protein [Eubacteriales bacterium]|nr:cyclic nucleotide-binding domain-containing protein [Eubacteriales bacterium]
MRESTELERLTAALRGRLPPLAAYPAELRRFSPGEALVRQGEPLTHLCLLLQGRARVYTLLPNGRTLLHALSREAGAIGDLELLQGRGTIMNNVQALSAGAMACIPLETCQSALMADPVMLRYLGGELAAKLCQSTRYAAQNMLYPLSARLAAYLGQTEPDGVFDESLIRVSEQLGVSYRHLLRTLHDFCARGLLERCPGGYRVLNAEALRREGAQIDTEL